MLHSSLQQMVRSSRREGEGIAWSEEEVVDRLVVVYQQQVGLAASVFCVWSLLQLRLVPCFMHNCMLLVIACS